MCPPPCGPRRRSRSYEPAIKTKITKSAVEQVIMASNYECSLRKNGSVAKKACEMSSRDLCAFLHDGKTKVKVAGRRSEYFLDEYQTILMDVPTLKAVVIIRTPAE